VRLRRLDPEDIRVLHDELRMVNEGASRQRADYVLDKVLARLPRAVSSESERRVNALVSMLQYCSETPYEAQSMALLCSTRWLQAHGPAVEEAFFAMGPHIIERLVEALRPGRVPMARSAFEAGLRALVRLEAVSAVPAILENLSVRTRGHRAMLCALEELTAHHPDLREQVRAMIRECASASRPALEQQFWPAMARGGMSTFRLGLIRARYRNALQLFRDRDRDRAYAEAHRDSDLLSPVGGRSYRSR